MSKIGPILKKLWGKNIIFVLIYNFLIYAGFVVVFGIYAFVDIIIMAKIERKYEISSEVECMGLENGITENPVYTVSMTWEIWTWITWPPILGFKNECNCHSKYTVCRGHIFWIFGSFIGNQYQLFWITKDTYLMMSMGKAYYGGKATI